MFILLTLMDEAEKIPVAGKVIWIAKKGVKQPHAPGVGIQFTDPDNVAKDKIETYLAGQSRLRVDDCHHVARRSRSAGDRPAQLSVRAKKRSITPYRWMLTDRSARLCLLPG